jgi:tape measure domain-containing protein
LKVSELFVRLAMDFSQYDKDEATAQKRVQSSGSTLGGIVKNAFSFTVGMGFFQAIQAGFKATVGSALGFNVMVQNAQIGFKTMLGSASAAEAMLTDLADFAAKNQFELPDLLDAAKRMLAMGFAADDVLPTLKSVGDAAAGLGLGAAGVNRIILALGQMQAKGKVSGEEMRQLMEAGVPAWKILAQAMGKSVQEVTALGEKGLLPADKAIQALVAGMEARFPDMMKQMQNGWRGVTSAIKSVWQMTLGALTSGLFKSANDWLKKVRDVATGFYKAFGQGGLSYAISQTFGPQAAAGIQTVTSVLRGLWGVLVGVGRAIIANWSLIAPVLKAVLAVDVAVRLVAAALMIAKGAVRAFTTANLVMHGTLTTGSGLLALISRMVGMYRLQIQLASVAWMTGGPIAVGWLQRIQAALYAVNSALGPVGWAIIAISAVLTAGTSLWARYSTVVAQAAQKAQAAKIAKMQEELAASAKKAATGTNAQADALGNLGKASQDNLQSFDEVHQIMDQTADTSFPGVPDTGAGGAPGVPESEMPDLAAELTDSLEAAKLTFSGFLGWMWDGIKGTFDNIKSKITEAFQALRADPIIQGIAITLGVILTPALIKTGVEAAIAAARMIGGWIASGIQAGISVATQIGHFVVLVAKWVWMGLQATINAGKVVWAWIVQGLEAGASAALQIAQFVILGAKWVWLGIQSALNAGKVVLAWVVQGVEAAASVATQVAQFIILGAKWVWMGIQATVNAGKIVLAWVVQGVEAAASVAVQIAQFVLAGAKWVWLGIQAGLGAAKVVAAWLIQQAQAIASVAVQIAQIVILGAKWVWMGIVAMAEAAKMAAAWFIALGPVGWVIGVIVALAALIALKWDWVKTKTLEVWSAVSAWLSAKWDGIKAGAQSVWDAIVASVKAVKDTLYEYIVEPFVKAKNYIEGLIAKAKEWGRNLLRAFTGGMRAEIPATVQAAGDVAGGISNQMGFQSPAKEGPGRYADRWAPSLMRMYAQGILANVSIVRSAAGAVAQSLASMAVVPTPAFAGTGVGGGAGAGRQPRASIFGSGPAQEIHLHVGTLVADRNGLKQLERMLREFRVSEDQRVGQER